MKAQYLSLSLIAITLLPIACKTSTSGERLPAPSNRLFPHNVPYKFELLSAPLPSSIYPISFSDDSTQKSILFTRERQIEGAPRARDPLVDTWTSPWEPIQIVTPPEGNTIPYPDLLSEVDQVLEQDAAAILRKVSALREENRKKGTKPRMMISGAGPVGLLAALEAYLGGAEVAIVEKRKSYSRGQILRLNEDVIDRIKFFVGEAAWAELRHRGIVSESPNWQPNAAKDNPKNIPSKYDTDHVEIIRISHLEILLSEALQRYAKNDETNLKMYYGSEITSLKLTSTGWNIEITDSQKNVIPTSVHWVVSSEGPASKLREVLGINLDIITKKLYGSTTAFIIPDGFPSEYRPIENAHGTASIPRNSDDMKPESIGVLASESSRDGIAVVDNMKPEHHMVNKADLLTSLNALFENAGLSQDVVATLRLTEVPRTRFFVTGGIFYLGAEVTGPQYDFFTALKDPSDPTKGTRLDVHQEFMRILTAKHIPMEWTTSDVLKISEPDPKTQLSKSQSIFPIELQQATYFTIENHMGKSVFFGTAIGDTYATTHFFTGTGAVNGLRQATFLGTAIQADCTPAALETANQQAFEKTVGMQDRVMRGAGNAPLDGPFNPPVDNLIRGAKDHIHMEP